MIKYISLFSLCLFLLIANYTIAQNFGGNPSSIKWKQVNNSAARVIFPAGLDSQANRAANLMLYLNKATASSIGGNSKKWNIVLQNQTTIPNAYVRMAPKMSELFMVPGQDNFSTGSIRWDDNLVIHENRHIQQFSNFNKGLTKLFTFFLGEEGQLFANGITVPDYFFEGDAVWQETLVSEQGRGRMPSFYNGAKALWLGDKNYSWMKWRSGSYKHYAPDHYTLGYLIIAYGYEKYGVDFWKKVTEDAVAFKGLFYSFNQAIKRHSGKSYKLFREDALQYFKQKSIPKNVDPLNYISPVRKNNVVDYLFPNYIGDDSILVLRKAYNQVPVFCVLNAGKEIKLRVRDLVLDDYYSYKNGKLVYAAYESDARWGNRDYSVIQMLDIKTGEQRQLTKKTKYFSPDINETGSEILVVEVYSNGGNNLKRISVASAETIQLIPNPNNYFFTQTKYIDENYAVSAVRRADGKMALVKVDLSTGTTETLTPFSYKVLGTPVVSNSKVYFSAMDNHADKIFAVDLVTLKIFRISNNANGMYQPAINEIGDLLAVSFTADGHRITKLNNAASNWKEIIASEFEKIGNQLYSDDNFKNSASGILDRFEKNKDESYKTNTISKYKKTFKLFNFHSWRPVLDDPEYGYSFVSDNVLSSFNNSINYTYNRNDQSHTIGFNATYAGFYPILSLGVEESFNRRVDTAIGKSVLFNSANIKAGAYIPFQFVGGRTYKYLTIGGGYNVEQYYYKGVGKNVFSNRAIHYMNTFLSFSNSSQKAKQHINPRWAQAVTLSYKDAFNFRNSRKFVSNSTFYFPGLFPNHSLVINGSFQKRDSLPDLFTNTFSYSRGYQALSTRRMYKTGVNYHFPIVYPDWGFGNILYFQRIRANAFYDFTNAKARVNGKLTEIINRSTGTEVYFDSKLWNALPVSFGVRYSRLLDKDLLNPLVKNRWEIIIPIGLIPN